MNIKDLKQELHQIGIDINDSAIVSTLKEAGLTVEDVTDKSLDVVIEIFEEKYPQSTKSTSLTTQHSEIPEKPIASIRSTGGAALATATAPQTKAAIEYRPDPTELGSISEVQAIYADIEVQIEAAESEHKDALIEYACSLIDREEQLKNLVRGAINARRQGTLREFQMDSVHSHQQMSATLTALKDRDDAFFRATAAELQQRVGGVGNTGAS